MLLISQTSRLFDLSLPLNSPLETESNSPIPTNISRWLDAVVSPLPTSSDTDSRKFLPRYLSLSPILDLPIPLPMSMRDSPTLADNSHTLSAIPRSTASLQLNVKVEFMVSIMLGSSQGPEDLDGEVRQVE